MDPVLEGLVNLYVGGELEVQNGIEGYAFRGKIATLEFLPSKDDSLSLLKVTLEWMAKADGKPLGGGYVPTNGWDEDANLEYACNTDLPNSKIGEPHLPIVQFNMGPEGSMRMIIFNPFTGEMTVLFPKGGSQLDHTQVRWLPDGPKAQADAARRKANTNNSGENTQ